MPIYTYKVKSESGKIYAGESKFSSEAELVAALTEKNLTPVEVKVKNAITDISQLGIFKKKVKLKDLSVFCRQFAIELEAGVPIAQSLDVLREQAQNPTLKEALNDLYEDIQKGRSMSSSMKKHGDVFPDLLVNMVEAGEFSGQLDRVFVRLADSFEKDYKLEQKIKGAMVYPIIVLVIATAIIFIILSYVVPTFAGVIRDMGGDLPSYTKFLLALGDFFSKFWWAILIALLAAVIGIKSFIGSPTGKRLLGRLAISLPIIKSVTQSLVTSRFTRTLGTLVSSGVLLIQAMEIVQKVVGNSIIAEQLELVSEEIKKGNGLTRPLANMKYFPPLLISMVRIGEESGDLDFTLSKSADFYDQEVDVAVQKLTTFIEPVIMILLGGVVGFIMISVMYPMITMYQSMGQ